MSNRPRKFLEDDVRVRHALIRDIVDAKMNTRALCDKYGCTADGLASFKRRHRDTIETVKANLENKLAGLWIADKWQRVASYQTTVEIADDEIAKAREGRLSTLGRVRGDDDVEYQVELVTDISDVIGRLERARHRALRSAAEELGQLPSRVALMFDDAKKVKHLIEGVDLDKL